VEINVDKVKKEVNKEKGNKAEATTMFFNWKESKKSKWSNRYIT